MRPEFPIDRWLRKHMTPGRTMGGMAILFIGMWFMNTHAPQYREAVVTFMLCSVAVFIAPAMAWWVYWNIKYPYKPELCKECKRALPEKHED
jgi:hypothetical protein